MISPSIHSFAGSTRRGLTLVELLVSLTMLIIVISGVVMAFTEVLRSNDRAQARLEATAHARAALDSLTIEVKRARSSPINLVSPGPTPLFEGETSSTTFGDFRDQDFDGVLDEEVLDGLDNDNDWLLADDRHAAITTAGVSYFERPRYRNLLDLGDVHMDVDFQNDSSQLSFETFDVPGEPLNRRVDFYLGSDGTVTTNVLMKRVTGFDVVSGTTVTLEGPVAYNVASFTGLFYDAELGAAGLPPWRRTWPAATNSFMSAPVSVYLNIKIYSGTPVPFEMVPYGTAYDTIAISTVVNVEATMGHPRYTSLRPPVLPVPTP